MKRFEVKLRVSGSVFVTVDAEDEFDAECKAEEMVNKDPTGWLDVSKDLWVEATDCKES